jgi:hypothetical protein
MKLFAWPVATAALVGLLGASLPACSSDPGSAEEDLTSITARERSLEFEGYVYVHPDTSDSEILAAAHAQTRSAFGALMAQNVAVGSREMANVDPASFVKEPVSVVDSDGETYESLRVRYRYTDRAVVPHTMAHRSVLSLGLLSGDYQQQADRILLECTKNTADDREMRDDVWYVFNPALDSCRDAMRDEQRAIDTASEQTELADGRISMLELERLYLPISASLKAVEQSQRKRYPEYDRLWAGGVEDGKLVITLLNGMIDHAKPGQTHHPVDDAGYWEMLAEMDVILQARPNMKVVSTDPPTDLSRFQVDGQQLDGLTFQNFIDWELYEWGLPSGLTAAQQKQLRSQVADRLTNRWIRFEETVDVAIGGAAPTPTTIVIQQYFGVEDEFEPYRRSVRTSDVFMYNGHSYIGEGPLDPGNFSNSDFPDSYQMFFIDSCLSFNYYNSDYFDLKAQGSLDLDVISNGLESFSDGAGVGQGRFVAALLSGAQPSYKELLEAAGTAGIGYEWGKDALRVVDGELDNVYMPSQAPISVTSR